MRITASPLDNSEEFASLDDISPYANDITIMSDEEIILDVSDYIFPDLTTFESDENVKLIGAMKMIVHSPKLRRFGARFMDYEHWVTFPYLPELYTIDLVQTWLLGKCLDISQLPALSIIYRHDGHRSNPLSLLIAGNFGVELNS